MSSNNLEKVEVIIIGAGVIGCALAHALTLKGIIPLVLESGPRIAEGTTSRNSGVIHAGIYYPPGSLKAQSCIRGSQLLYEWCKTHDVPHLRCGKWIVGSSLDEQNLTDLYENATQAGAIGLSPVSAIPDDVRGVNAEIGIFSSNTGIVDPYEFSRSLTMAGVSRGAEFIFNASVKGITRIADGYRVESTRGVIDTELVFNASGLQMDEISATAGIHKYTIYPCRGDYFKLNTPQKYRHLIYPVKRKDSAGLGVHLTIGLDGSYRLGPDAYYVQSKSDFSEPLDVDARRKKFFVAASALLSGIHLEQLTYDTCGVRPKLRSPLDLEEKDFIISQDLPGFINLAGIESPGLTASLDLAERAVALLFS